MAQVKGSAVKASVVFLRERLGPDGFMRLLKEMPQSQAEALSAPILLGNWYDLSLLLTLMTLAEEKLAPPPNRTLAWELGRFSAEYGLKTVYRIFFKFADPHFIISKAPQIFSSYYDSGTMQVDCARAGSALVRLMGFDQPHRLFCERFMGWMERTLELTGAEWVELKHTKCMVRRDPFCEYDAHWK